MAALNSMPAVNPRIENFLDAIKYFIDAAYPARAEIWPPPAATLGGLRAPAGPPR